MKYTLIILVFLATIICPAPAQELIIPTPQKTTGLNGEFTFNAKTKVFTTDSIQQNASSELRRLMLNSALLSLRTAKKQPKKNAVCYQFNPKLTHEAYILEITPDLITIQASDSGGYFYATQSLLQLLPTDIYVEKKNQTEVWSAPALLIEDAPRFQYRGFMLDVSRFFLPKDKVFKILDFMALHKLNKFHWHLVDDNGWRLEIKRYPRLTTIGSSKPARAQQLFQMQPAPQATEPIINGGFYTQDDVREIVAYAAKRCIEIIPEIEMPAHTSSSLRAYPELACPIEKTRFSVYCAGKDEVFDFLQNVIDEVITLFPSSYIHIGGDEANKEDWRRCSACQQRMKDNQIPNEEELQSYFIKRINTYLQLKGKKLMGWDELVDSELPANSTIFGWRGLGHNAIKAAQKGHPIVLTPAKKFYLIRYQGPQWFEPFTYFGDNTLADIYNYKIEDSGVTPELSHLVLGLQAGLWTEFIYSWENAQYMISPRLAALAENAWCTHPKDWQHFLKRLDHLTTIYEKQEIPYATSMFNLYHTIEPLDGQLYASVSCIRPDVQIRYTMNGEYPGPTSPIYTNKVPVKKGDLFQAATFIGNNRKGAVLQLNTTFNKATGTKVISLHPNAFVLTNGLTGSDKCTDGEFLDTFNEDMSFTIDLGQKTDFSKIELGTMINAGMRICLPKEVIIETSDNNSDYQPLTKKVFNEDLIFTASFIKYLIEIDNFEPKTTRYLRFTLKNPGKCPVGHLMEGSDTRMAIDEVIIE